jgi:hypothetical protein
MGLFAIGSQKTLALTFDIHLKHQKLMKYLKNYISFHSLQNKYKLPFTFESMKIVVS